MKTRLDEIKRMQKLAGIVSSNYRFLKEEEEAANKSDDSKGEEGSKEVKKLDDKELDHISKALEMGDELEIPKKKVDILSVKDTDSALALAKQILPDEEYKKAEQNAKLIKDKGGIDKVEASNEKIIKEEGATATVIAVASLIPLALSAVGSIADGVYQKFGGFTVKEKADLRAYVKQIKKAEKALKELRKQRKPGKGEDEAKDKEMEELMKSLRGQRAAAKEKVAKKKADKQEKEKYFSQSGEGGPNESLYLREDYEEGYGISREFFDVDLEKKIDALERKIDKIDVVIAKKYRTQIGEALRHAGHKLHEKYTAPIRAILLVFGMWDNKKRHTWANIIYAVAMLAYGLKTGLVHHVAASLKGVQGVGEIVNTALHSLEAGKSVIETIKGLAQAATGS